MPVKESYTDIKIPNKHYLPGHIALNSCLPYKYSRKRVSSGFNTTALNVSSIQQIHSIIRVIASSPGAGEWEGSSFIRSQPVEVPHQRPSGLACSPGALPSSRRHIKHMKEEPPESHSFASITAIHVYCHSWPSVIPSDVLCWSLYFLNWLIFFWFCFNLIHFSS